MKLLRRSPLDRHLMSQMRWVAYLAGYTAGQRNLGRYDLPDYGHVHNEWRKWDISSKESK